MVKDDPGSRRLALRVMALLILGVAMPVAATSYLLALWLSPVEGERPANPPVHAVPAAAGPRLFHDWPADRRPDVVLVLTGQQYGYYEPCGCSSPQLGGLERRWNFIQSLRTRGWPVVALDLGDVLDPPKKRGPQTLLKYRYTMDALKAIGYRGMAIGQHELELPLLTTVAHWALNNFPTPPTLLAANLQDRPNNSANCVESWVIAAEPGQPAVGIVGAVGPSVANTVKAIPFAGNGQALAAALKEMQDQKEKPKPQLLVLLYQGSVDEAKEAARRFPQFQVVLCLTEESEPSDKPEKEGETLIVNVGHKGRYLGVVGAYANAAGVKKPFELRYQMVPMTEEYKVPADQLANHPIAKILEQYATEVHTGNYLDKYPQSKHPTQLQYPKAEYVGSDACMGCHRESYKVWSNSDHAHAYQTLVDVKHPPLRQFDGECIACHVVGFGYETGFKNFKTSADLINVGCESCHGPASLHVDKPKNTELHALMNPYRSQPNETEEQAKKRQLAIDLSCQKCHDIDNDVNWNFQKKWPFIVHREPKKAAAAPNAPAPALKAEDK